MFTVQGNMTFSNRVGELENHFIWGKPFYIIKNLIQEPHYNTHFGVHFGVHSDTSVITEQPYNEGLIQKKYK